jgi:hypothetical protein
MGKTEMMFPRMKKYEILSSESALVDGEVLPVGGLEQPKNVNRLAFAILSKEVGFDGAMRYSNNFRENILDHCRAGNEISSEEIQEWHEFMREPTKDLPGLLRTRRFLKT